MMATSPPSCLRPPPDPSPSPCMFAPLEALCPVIPPEPPDPADGPFLPGFQSNLSSAVSPSSLVVVVIHPSPLLGAALICTSETTGSMLELWLARSVWFCILEAPTPLHATSDPLIDAENPFCYDSALFISAVYPCCSNTAYFNFDVFNTLHGICTSLSSLTEFDGEQFWVNFIELLWIQYGNIGFRSLSLNSTKVFFSTSVKHIQRVVARYLCTQSVFRRMKLFPSCLSYSVAKTKRVIKEFIVLILVDLVQIMAIESFSSLFLRVHIAQFQSSSASEPQFIFFSVKSSLVGLGFLESFISSLLIAEAILRQSVLCMAIPLEFSTLKVLTNSLTLIRAISGNFQSKEIIGFVKDIRSISSGLATSSIYHFSISDNLVVYELAKRLFKLISLCIEHHDLNHSFGFISSY